MGLLQKIAQALAGESGELKRIREEAESRRASKSSARNPKVDGAALKKTSGISGQQTKTKVL